MTAMMTPTVFYIKSGDTAPIITATLIDQTGAIANLTGANVWFRATNAFFGNIINSPATIVNATAGQVSYSWGSTDTQNPGTYSTQWYVVYSSGTQESYPQGFYDTLQIDPSLNIGFPQLQATSPLFNTIWNSTSAPLTLQGNIGDYWFDTATSYFYGPKTTLGWPAGVPVGVSGTPINYFGAATANVAMGGFSFTNLGYINATPSTSQVGLTVNAPSGSTVDVADFELNSVKYWWINDLGNLNGIGQLNVAPTSTTLTPMVVNSPSGTTVDVADFQLNGVTQWGINDIGSLYGIGQLNLSPTSTSINPLLVNIPSGSSANIATFQENGTTVWDISSGGVLQGNAPLVVTPSSTAVVPATFNIPSGSSSHVTNFQSNGTTVASVYGNGQVNGVALSATGVTGATANSRYVGATAGGAPASGTFATGDYVVDALNGVIYVCTASGSPGTWTSVSQGGTRIVATAISTSSASPNTSSTTETFDTTLGYYACNLVSGVTYRATVLGMVGSSNTAGNIICTARIRNSGSGSAPTSASTQVAMSPWFNFTTGGSGQSIVPLSGLFTASVTGTNTFGLSLTSSNGSDTFAVVGTRWLYVEIA